ncbi:MAG: hypothetical protein J6Y98_01965 [Bacteroidales bacterium]|nr:hypothetical protein [Bacteroidales bacterium]MCR5192975.1 gliding motility lipoprotein GldH [Bacteroidales bacterium]
MRKIILIIAAALVFGACGKKVIVDQTIPFENDCWLRFEPALFSVPIKDIDKNYAVSVTLKYDTSRLSGNELPLLVDFFADSNEMHNFTPTMRLKSADGTRRGQTIGALCSVTDTIDRLRSFNKPGTYTYRIKQRTSKYEIYGISSITLHIEKI